VQYQRVPASLPMLLRSKAPGNGQFSNGQLSSQPITKHRLRKAGNYQVIEGQAGSGVSDACDSRRLLPSAERDRGDPDPAGIRRRLATGTLGSGPVCRDGSSTGWRLHVRRITAPVAHFGLPFSTHWRSLAKRARARLGGGLFLRWDPFCARAAPGPLQIEIDIRLEIILPGKH
jgi:hypothetical protein